MAARGVSASATGTRASNTGTTTRRCGACGARLARRVRPGDTIITFNYDVSLERQLRLCSKWEVDGGCDLPNFPKLTPASPTIVLKLHGSTNWLDLVFRGHMGYGKTPPTTLGPRPVITPVELGYLGYDDTVRDPEFLGGGATKAGSMVMPGRNKRFYVEVSEGREREAFCDRFVGTRWSRADQGRRGCHHRVQPP
jgi:hypothetical protein